MLTECISRADRKMVIRMLKHSPSVLPTQMLAALDVKADKAELELKADMVGLNGIHKIVKSKSRRRH